MVLPDIANYKVTFNEALDQTIVQETITQCLGFPEDRHDDIVDCIVDSAKLVYKHIPSVLEVI